MVPRMCKRRRPPWVISFFLKGLRAKVFGDRYAQEEACLSIDDSLLLATYRAGRKPSKTPHTRSTIDITILGRLPSPPTALSLPPFPRPCACGARRASLVLRC